MKRVVKALILLYPQSWRERYQSEYEALLDEVAPTWKILFDVFGGAMKMQLKIGTMWKTVAAFAAAGMIAAMAFGLTIPDRFVSTAVIKMAGNPAAQIERALGSSWNKRDITLRPAGPDAVRVSFSATDAKSAKQGTERIAAALIESGRGALVDPASMPGGPESPRRSRIAMLGFTAGLIVGTFFAVFHGLRSWTLAAALAIAGAVLFGAGSFLIPDRYASTAVILCSAGQVDAIHQLTSAIVSGANMDAVASRFGLYGNDSSAGRKLREHLHIELLGNDAVRVQFVHTDRFVAQKVTQEIVSQFIESNVTIPAPKMTLETIEPGDLPLSPYFPDHANIAVGGMIVGLTAATVAAIWKKNRTAEVI
jgi:uncharacterized protein involved in exopolysaccharide biosynthesis